MINDEGVLRNVQRFAWMIYMLRIGEDFGVINVNVAYSSLRSGVDSVTGPTGRDASTFSFNASLLGVPGSDRLRTRRCGFFGVTGIEPPPLPSDSKGTKPDVIDALSSSEALKDGVGMIADVALGGALELRWKSSDKK